MRKLVFIFIGVPLLLAAGLWGYLWYSTQQNMDHLVRLMQPFATVNYRGIHASLLGSVGVNELRITPVGETDTLRIAAVRIRSSNVLELLKVNRALQQQQLPPHLGLSILGIEQSLYSDAFAYLAPFAIAHGCGDRDWLEPEDFEALGVEQLISDVIVDLVNHPGSDQLTLSYQFAIQDVADWQMGAELLLESDAFSNIVTEVPQVMAADFLLTDHGFMDRKLTYCTERSGLDETAFILAHSDAVLEDLSEQGIAVSEDLANGYRQFMSLSNTVSLQLDPDSAINPAELIHYQPADLPRLLNLSLSVNGKPVEDIGIRLLNSPSPERVEPVIGDVGDPEESEVGNSTASVATDTTVSTDDNDTSPQQANVASPDTATPDTIAEAVSTMPAADSTEVAKDVLQAAPTGPTFQVTPVSQLKQFVGHQAIIDTTTGRQHRGVLESVSGGQISLRVRVSSGSFAVPVQTKGITRVQVAP